MTTTAMSVLDTNPELHSGTETSLVTSNVQKMLAYIERQYDIKIEEEMTEEIIVTSEELWDHYLYSKDENGFSYLDEIHEAHADDWSRVKKFHIQQFKDCVKSLEYNYGIEVRRD